MLHNCGSLDWEGFLTSVFASLVDCLPARSKTNKCCILEMVLTGAKILIGIWAGQFMREWWKSNAKTYNSHNFRFIPTISLFPHDFVRVDSTNWFNKKHSTCERKKDDISAKFGKGRLGRMNNKFWSICTMQTFQGTMPVCENHSQNLRMKR